MHVNSLCLESRKSDIYCGMDQWQIEHISVWFLETFYFTVFRQKFFFPENLFDISSILWVYPLTRRYHISGTNGQVVQLLEKV